MINSNKHFRTSPENKKRRASALLVAVLVMGILLTLTMGLSSLVVREITQTADLVNSGKAYYAAEAGIENALLDLHQNLPGYETRDQPGAEDDWVTGGSAGGLNYRYKISNRGNSYPYFQDDKPVFLSPGVAVTKDFLYAGNGYRDQTYNILPLNKTVTIPLFIQTVDAAGSKVIKNVDGFLLEYYVNFDDDLQNLYSFGGDSYKHLDVLRWKVFGQTKDGTGKTDAISDFFPSKPGDSADNPVCLIGTTEDWRSIDDTGVDCNIPVLSISGADGQISDNTSNFVTAARECYFSDAGGLVAPKVEDEVNAIQKGCDIHTFITSHEKNYLTITNVVNPDVIGITNLEGQDDDELAASKANIYYRVIARGDQGDDAEAKDVLPLEYAQISADGFGPNNLKQSIDAKIKLNSFLPVFNFSLYRTDTDSSNP